MEGRMQSRYREALERAAHLAQAADHHGALAAYGEAIELAPWRPDAHYEMGLLHHKLGQAAEAIACFERAAELAPEDATVWNNLGVLHYSRNDVTQAEEAFRRAIGLDQRYTDAWYGLARALLQQSREVEAAHALRNCLRWEPQHSKAQAALIDLGCKAPASKVSGLRIGFVSLWFERGQAYVTRMLRDALSQEHQTFVLARSGGTAQQPLLATTGEWAVPNLTTWREYDIPHDVMRQWLTQNRLDVVIFNEEYDLGLVWLARTAGARTVGCYYWELFNPALVSQCNALYNRIICPTDACYRKFHDLGLENLVRVRWAIDSAIFKPRERVPLNYGVHEPNEHVRFFHPAGWGGMHARRGTQFVIDAFLRADLSNAELLIHTQQGKGKQQRGNITVLRGTVPREELVRLYQEADVAVLPSKWEGLGLTFLEAIGCGLPIITVDAPPMNEFVRDGETGFLCKVAERQRYQGIFVEGVHVDLDDMAEKMRMLACPDLLVKMRERAREFSREFSKAGFAEDLRDLVREETQCLTGGDRQTLVLCDREAATRGMAKAVDLVPDDADAMQQCLCQDPTHAPGREALSQLHPDIIRPIMVAMPFVSLPAEDHSPLRLMSKHYSDCHLAREGGRLHLVKGDRKEWFRVHLVSARWSNHPWGMGNQVYRALKDMGFDVVDTDFRKDRHLLAHLLKQEAHLTLVLKGEGIPSELVRQIPGVAVLWYPDDLLATQHGPRHIAYNGHAFDLVFGFARYDLGEYARYGVARAKWLPLACDPHLHRNLDLPKVHDVCFVGNVYPNRAALLERLGQRFDLHVARAFTEEMVRIYNQSRIVLNLGIGKGGIQQRVFEALGCGSFLLTNELPPEDRLFEDRVHLVYYNDDNIEDLIEYYLAHEEEREDIARQGRDEVIRNHTFVHRIEQMLGDVLRLVPKRPVVRPYPAPVASTPDVESALRWADRRVKHTGWCISKRALRLLVAKLPAAGIQDVTEFGAGYSTLFLAKLFELRSKPLRITSFEHQQVFFHRLKAALRSFPEVRLISSGLKQLSDDEYEVLFSSRQPPTDYLELGAPVPRQLYAQTRLHNVFYDGDPCQHICRKTDLVILDGPNGNGRSIVFPLLKGLVQMPFWCFIDDVTHHPYMEELARLFSYETIFLENFGHDAYALARIDSAKGDGQSGRSLWRVSQGH